MDGSASPHPAGAGPPAESRTSPGETEPAPVTGSWTLDLRESSVRWSDEVHDIYGTDADTFTPTLENVFAHIHPVDRPRTQALIERWRSDKRPFGMVHRVIRPDGAVRVVDVCGWVAEDDTGMSQRVLGTVRDITEAAAQGRERTRLSHQRAAILAAVEQGVCGVDVEGRVSFANQALEEMIGRRPRQIEGARLHDLIHSGTDAGRGHPPTECPYLHRSDERARGLDSWFHRADGSVIEVVYVLVPIDDAQEPPESVISFWPVTEAAAAERMVERERARIAADIHDDTIQTLNALQLRLERGLVTVNDPAAKQILDRTRDEVRDATTRLRHLMFELMPPVPEHRLSSAVETYSGLLFENTPIAHEVSGDPVDIPQDTYLLAYRLIQEALRNVLKHASATRARTDLELRAGALVARISDDGVGFAGPGPPATHAGLRIVRQRARAAGGSATTTDVGLEERGSSIVIRLPLQNAGG